MIFRDQDWSGLWSGLDVSGRAWVALVELESSEGGARAQKPSDIERQSSLGSPQTFPRTQESIEAP